MLVNPERVKRVSGRKTDITDSAGRELCGQCFDERERSAVERRCGRRLERLGNAVILQRLEAPT